MTARGSATLLQLAVSLVAFAQQQRNTPRDQQLPQQPPASTEAPKPPLNPADSAGAPVDPRSYVIGAEDILAITVWREADFTKAYAVRPDGKITLPLVRDVQAEGLTPERLSSQLKQALSDYINNPDVTVSVLQVNSKKYYITGEVNRAGQFPMPVPTRIFDALSNAGGFRDFANRKDIIIIRGNQRLHFNYDEFLKGKRIEQNVFLENGDTIIVR